MYKLYNNRIIEPEESVGFSIGAEGGTKWLCGVLWGGIGGIEVKGYGVV